jgi:hypothetical protein
MKAKKFKLGPIQRAWVRALRSGKYKQGEGKLSKSDRHCCLGVLCQLAVKAKVPLKMEEGDFYFYYDSQEDYLPAKVRRWAATKSTQGGNVNGQSLADLNDNGYSFKKIADIIEKNAAKIFTRSV